MISFEKLGRIFVSAFLTVCLSLTLMGCGKDSEVKEEMTASVMSDEALGDYTYVADYLPLDLGNSYNYQYVDGKLYSIVSDDLGYSNLVAVDPVSGAEALRTDMATVFPIPDEMVDGDYFYAGVSSYEVLEDGRVLCVLNQALYHGEDFETISHSYEMATLSSDGEVISRTDLTEVTDQDEDYLQYITSDQSENTILVFGKKIVCLGPDSQILGTIPLSEDSWVSSVLRLEKENLLMMYDTDWNMNAYRMNFESGQLEEAYTDFNSNANYFFAGADDTVLVCSSSSLYRRNLETGSSETILNWAECDIVGDYVNSVFENTDGSFSVMLYNWDDSSTEIANLHRVARAEIGNVTEITIATLYPDQGLTRKAVGFNKSQKQIHVNVKAYYDYDSDMSYDDAESAFNNALTGSNPPDLVVLDSVNSEMLNSKSLLEDLQPYLDNSTAVSALDYEDFVLDCNRKNGKLLAIPTGIYIDTLVVNSDLVGGDRMGWTVDEMLDLLEAHPGASALEYSNRDYVMNYFLRFAMDGFVDWENGTCNFDSETFRRILAYLATQPEEFEWDDNDSRSAAGKIADGDLLFLQTSMGDPSEIQVNDAVMGGKAVYIGYPTLDGTPTANMQTYGGYAIMSNSTNKDAAWKFIEFSTTGDLDFYGLPARTSERNKALEDYLNGKHNIEGNGVGWGDDFSYSYHNVTQEEVDLYKKVLATGKVRTGRNDEIIQIISEEAAPFYAGQKTVDEVVQIIQSRVSLYVNENR